MTSPVSPLLYRAEEALPTAAALAGVRLNRQSLVRALAAAAALVVLAHVLALLAATRGDTGPRSYFVADLPGYARLFHLDGEHNVPAQFSALLLLVNAALFLVWQRARVAGAPHLWLLCAAAFSFLAVDELFELHERLGTALREAFGFTGVLYYAWILPYALLTLALAGLALPAFLRLPRAMQARLCTAAALYLAGAVGMEMLGGHLLSTVGLAPSSLAYLVCITLEEGLELAGLVLLVDALARGVPPARDLELRLGPAPGPLP